MKTFITQYEAEFEPLLNLRASGFKEIFRLLESLNKDYYSILETGTCRWTGNWSGDGQSTVLFDRFVNFHDGDVCSVDITPEHCDNARRLVSSKTNVINSDSVPYLWQIPQEKKFDLVYLDSYDVDFNNPHPAAIHHVMELLSIINKNLHNQSIIVVDDHNFGKGKGMYISEFMNKIGVQKVFEEYQVVYKLS
jgi:predicted O-methyltransferase YrrM